MLRVSWLISVIVVILIEFQNTNAYLNVTDNPGEACNRVCRVGEPRVCYFEFHLENYQAMGAACGDCAKGVVSDCFKTHCLPVDGVEKGVNCVNRQVPGPEIHVCENDMIVVDVINQMGGTTATIHWHGVHQNNSPFMDGVPFVTQCPIEYSTTFRYKFKGTQPGTQWWHGHAGHHKMNGVYGALIIHRPEFADPNRALYNTSLPEHVIVISDWSHETAEMFSPGLPTRPNGLLPDTLLINGHGQAINPLTGNRTTTPFEVYDVLPNQKYRFRLINAVATACATKCQVENHSLQVIATDSFDVEPRQINTLYSSGGERYDFIINTNQPPADYWIRCRFIGPCDAQGIEQVAYLRYKTLVKQEREVPLVNAPYPTGTSLNFPNTTCFDKNPNDICVDELSASTPDLDLQNATPDVVKYLGFDNIVVSNDVLFKKGRYSTFMNLVGNLTLMGAINGIQFQTPPKSLLTQRDELDDDVFCDEEGIEYCNETNVCTCTHRIKVPSGAVVDLILVDESSTINVLNHVFHLHGCKFLVMNMGQLANGVHMTRQLYKEMEANNTLPVTQKNHTFPFKDTVSIPSKGFAKIRVHATNPGFWYLHCHWEFHMTAGMSLVLQIGEYNEMVKTPPNFPKCGHYKPPINDYDLYTQ